MERSCRVLLSRDDRWPISLYASQHQPAFSLPTAYKNALHVYSIVARESTGEKANHTLADSEGQASRAYGIQADALILIRPDGYIGLTGGTISQEPLINYLREVIG